MNKKRMLRFESLEDRKLLSLNAGSLDWQTLVDQNCLASPNNPIFVTTLLDVSDETDGLISLREAIDYAGTTTDQGSIGGFVRFDCAGTIRLNGSALAIAKNLNIDASDVAGITIDANDQSRVFYLRGTTTAGISVSLQSLNLTNSSPGANDSAPTNGGAIYNGSLSRLTLSNVEISDSFAVSGGAIYNLGNLALDRCRLDSNQANQGGAIYNAGAGTLSVERSAIENNAAESYAGGILNAGTAWIADSCLSKNQAVSSDGGAIYNVFSGRLSIDSSDFAENLAYQNGGAIFLANGTGTVSLRNSLLIRNEAQTGSGGAIYNEQQGSVALNDSNFQANLAYQNGGAIFNGNAGTIDLIASVFAQNQARTGSGGAIQNDVDSAIVLIDVDLNDNVAAAFGGGIDNVGNLAASGSNLARNRAGIQGGGLRNGGTALWTAGEICENSVVAEGTGAGGGIFNLGTFSLYNSTVGYNSIQAERGTGGGVSNAAGTLTVQNSLLIQNEVVASDGIGGGIFNSNGANANVSYSSLLGNIVPNEGGAVYSLGTFAVSYSNISQNRDETGEAVFHDESYSGSGFSQTQTVVADNLVYSVDRPESENSIIVSENDELVSNLADFGIQTSATGLTKTLLLTNSSDRKILLSARNLFGNAAALFELQLFRSDGTPIRDDSFAIDSNESVRLIVSTKSNVSDATDGANVLRISWTSQNLLPDGSLDGTPRVLNLDCRFVLTQNRTTTTLDPELTLALTGDGGGDVAIRLNSLPNSTVFLYLLPEPGLDVSQTVLTFDSETGNQFQTVALTADVEALIRNPGTESVALRFLILTNDSFYSGTVVSPIEIPVQDYIVVQDGGSINLTDDFSADARWDLNGSGVYSAKDWVSSDEFEGDEASGVIFVSKKEAGVIEAVPVEIENVAPILDVETRSNADASLLELRLTALPDDSFEYWRIRWGDGTSQLIASDSNDLTVLHFYAQPGDFEIDVELLDSLNASTSPLHIATHNVPAAASPLAASDSDSTPVVVSSNQPSALVSESNQIVENLTLAPVSVPATNNPTDSTQSINPTQTTELTPESVSSIAVSESELTFESVPTLSIVVPAEAASQRFEFPWSRPAAATVDTNPDSARFQLIDEIFNAPFDVFPNP